MADTPRTFLDAGELDHNGPLLLGAVKTTGGRGGGKGGGKGGGDKESKVLRGDVEGKVKGGGRGGQGRRQEEV